MSWHRRRHRAPPRPEPADGSAADLVRPAASTATRPPTASGGAALGDLFNGPSGPPRSSCLRRGPCRDVEGKPPPNAGRTPTPAMARSCGRRVGAAGRQPVARRVATRSRCALPRRGRRRVDPAYAILRQLGRDGGPGGRCRGTGHRLLFFAERPVTEDTDGGHGRRSSGRGHRRGRPGRAHRRRCMRPVRPRRRRDDFGAAHGRQLLDDADDETSTNVAP